MSWILGKSALQRRTKREYSRKLGNRLWANWCLYQNVWLLSEVPESYGIPKKDTGVDLVAEQKNGDLVAIQAKFGSVAKFSKKSILV